MTEADSTDDHHLAVPAQLVLYFHWIGKAVVAITTPIITAVYYVVSSLAFALVYLINLVYQPIAFLLQPVFYLGRFVLAVLAAPFRLLARFETLYIYLGVAALVGTCGGLLFYLLYDTLYKVLRLGPGPPSLPTPPRDARQYREEKQQQQQQQLQQRNGKGKLAADLASLDSPLSPTDTSMLGNGYFGSSDGGEASARRSGKKRRGLVAQTILEEEDSDF